MSLMEYFLKSVSLGVEVQSRQRKKNHLGKKNSAGNRVTIHSDSQ